MCCCHQNIGYYGNILTKLNPYSNLITGSIPFQTFDNTLVIPAFEKNGDRIIAKFNFLVEEGNLGSGCGLYFFFQAADLSNAGTYVHYAASTPTYGNSVCKVPYNYLKAFVTLEITRVNATTLYSNISLSVYDFVNSDQLIIPVTGTFYSSDVDMTIPNKIIPQILFGDPDFNALLEFITIDKIKAVC